MNDLAIETTHLPSRREASVDYLLDMIAELAKLARRAGEPGVAIHLEAILAAREAVRRQDG